jgi:hypothetical protein
MDLTEPKTVTSAALGLVKAIAANVGLGRGDKTTTEEAAAMVRDIAANVRADEDTKRRQLAATLDDLARKQFTGKLSTRDRSALEALLRENPAIEGEVVARVTALAAVRDAAEAAASRRVRWEEAKAETKAAEERLKNFERERLELRNVLARGQSRRAAASETEQRLVALIEQHRALLGAEGDTRDLAAQLIAAAGEKL